MCMKRIIKILAFVLLLLRPVSAAAKCGSVDYSLGAEALAGMHDYVVTMMLYVLYLCYAIGGLMAVISGFQIYVKFNTGEEGIMKDILTAFGACLFLITVGKVFPALFGYDI